MKHAGNAALDELEPLLKTIREVSAEAGSIERKRGVFYRKSKAFLHFHEDPTGLFADLRHGDGDFTRYPVSSQDERVAFLVALRKALDRGT